MSDLRRARSGTVSEYKMRDGSIQYRARALFGKTRASIGLYRTREEADAAVAKAIAGERLRGSRGRAQQQVVSHTDEHRWLVTELVRDGFSVRDFNKRVSRAFPMLAPSRFIPDAYRVTSAAIVVAEVEVHSFGAERWKPYAQACKRAGVAFDLVVVDRYGTRSQPFEWARFTTTDPVRARTALERAIADAEALVTSLKNLLDNNQANDREVHESAKST